MLSLLRSEWYQVRKALSVKITFGLILLASLIFGLNEISQASAERLMESGGLYRLYGAGSLCSSMEDGATGLLFASLFAGWLITAAFENRTIQETVSYGIGRSKVYIAKLLMFSFVVTTLCLIYWFGSSIPTFLKNGVGDPDTVGNLCHIEYIAGMVLAEILACNSLFSVCGFIGFWSRKSGITIGICIAGILAGGNLFAMFLPDAVMKIINYTPLGLYKQVLKLDLQWTDIWKTSFVSLAWIVIIYGIGLWRFQRVELK